MAALALAVYGEWLYVLMGFSYNAWFDVSLYSNIKYLCVKEYVMNTEEKNVKKKTEQNKPAKSRKEINKAILELSKKANRNMTKRMFKDLIDAWLLLRIVISSSVHW